MGLSTRERDDLNATVSDELLVRTWFLLGSRVPSPYSVQTPYIIIIPYSTCLSSTPPTNPS